MLKKIITQNQLERKEQRDRELEQKLLRHEAKIGGSLFGEMPSGGHREFFCLDERTWVWHEEWVDNQTGQKKTQTTRYDVRPDQILKNRNGQYWPVSKEEADHLLEAARAYREAVNRELYVRA